MSKLIKKRLQRVGLTKKQANWVLALVTMGWGLSYILLKIEINHIPPLSLIALRFSLASVILFLFFHQRVRTRTTLRAIQYGASLAIVMFVLIACLLLGMRTTEASTAGFLTCTAIVFVPIMQAILKRRLPTRPIVIGTIATTIGIALLSLKGSLILSSGALLCLAAAFLYAVHIILTDRLTHGADSFLIGFWQLVFIGLFAAIGTLLFETPTLPHNRIEWLALLGLAFFCSALTFALQPIGQKYTTPEHTALIFSLEPVFAAVFAFIALGEVLTTQAYIGALLILGSVILTAKEDASQ